MERKIIRFCYRKIIDASSSKNWDRHVFESTYKEFLLQAQLYNQEKKYTSFAALIQHVPGADKLHFLVSAAIPGYLQQLNGVIPDIVNSLGKHFLPFHHYRFEIINSDIQDKTRHQVAINFFSELLVWHDTIGSSLLVSPDEAGHDDNGRLTDIVALQPFLGIYSLKTETAG